MLDVAARLDALGHSVSVVCYDYDNTGFEDDVARRLDIRSVRSGSFHARTGKRVALRRVWREMPQVAALIPGNADVIHAHEWPSVHAAWRAGTKLDVPFVWSRNDHTIWERVIVPGVRDDAHHSSVGRIVRAVGSFPDLLAARAAAAIICLDEESRRMAERAYRVRAEVIPAPPAEHFFSPPDRRESRRRLGVGDDTFLVLGVGIMNPHRRFEDLVDAIAAIEDARVQALIIGSDHVDPGYGRFVAQRIRTAGVQDRVKLPLRTASEEELRAAYTAADLFVFPNDHRQTWGLAPLEALASGTPVVITRDSGIADAIGGRVGVDVVDPYAPRQVAAAIVRQLNAGAADLTETRAWVHEELGGRRYIERIVGVYERSVATNGSRS